MARVDKRLQELGLELPAEAKTPPGMTIPFEWVRVRGNRAFVSGHGPLALDGSPLAPFGKVPSQVSLEEAQALYLVRERDIAQARRAVTFLHSEEHRWGA